MRTRDIRCNLYIGVREERYINSDRGLISLLFYAKKSENKKELAALVLEQLRDIEYGTQSTLHSFNLPDYTQEEIKDVLRDMADLGFIDFIGKKWAFVKSDRLSSNLRKLASLVDTYTSEKRPDPYKDLMRHRAKLSVRAMKKGRDRRWN